MRMLAASAAFLTSSAWRSSGSVGACTTSNPTSRAILYRSAMLSFSGSIPNHTPFLRESTGGDARGFEVRPATKELANPPPPRPAAHAAVTEDFRNSRRVRGRIGNLNPVYLDRFSNPKLL